MRCGSSAERMSNLLSSTRPSDTLASSSGLTLTRLDAALLPTAKESGFQRCTLATTPPMETSSEARCTKEVPVVQLAHKGLLAPPPTPASVPQAELEIAALPLPQRQRLQDDQRGGQRGEPLQHRNQQGGALQGDQG